MNEQIEFEIILVLKEVESTTEFFIIKRVKDKLNCSESDIKNSIKNLLKKEFIISNYCDERPGAIITIKGEEEKYFLNPDKFKK